MEMAHCMVKSQALPHNFWLESVMCTTFVPKRFPIKSLLPFMHYETWSGRKPSTQLITKFLAASPLLLCQHHIKLENLTVKCIFVECDAESKGDNLYHPLMLHILVSEGVIFAENVVQPFLSYIKQLAIV